MDFVGTGIYSIAEAARYTGTKPNRLYSWFRNPEHALFESDYSSTKLQKAISFLDLIDVLVVAEMRDQGISMKHIREVRDVFMAEWKTEHPFCSERFYIDVTEKRIIEEVKIQGGDRLLVDALKKQSQFESVLAPCLKRVSYSSKTKLAQTWDIAESVLIDPRILLGKPVIHGTRIPTFVVASQFFAYGKDASAVSEIYEISDKDVLNAVKFERAKGAVKQAA